MFRFGLLLPALGGRRPHLRLCIDAGLSGGLLSFALIDLLRQPMLPAIGQRFQPECLVYLSKLFRGVFLRDVKPDDLRNRKGIRLTIQRVDLVASPHLALTLDCQVEACSPARKKSFHHVIHSKTDAQLVAGKPRLSDDNLGRTDRERVANMNRLVQSFDGEVLPEQPMGSDLPGSSALQ